MQRPARTVREHTSKLRATTPKGGARQMISERPDDADLDRPSPPHFIRRAAAALGIVEAPPLRQVEEQVRQARADEQAAAQQALTARQRREQAEAQVVPAR